MDSITRYDWKKARDKKAFLALEDGTVFHGYSIGAEVDLPGEAIFNTRSTGYQEILSSPSYAGQFVCLPAPEIGNYGVNPEDMESRRFHAAGLLIQEISQPSNWRGTESLTRALIARLTPAIAGVDTRAVVAALRGKGAVKAFLCASGRLSEADAVLTAKNWDGLAGKDLVQGVACSEAYPWDADNSLTAIYPNRDAILPPADYWAVAYDFGANWDLLRGLRRAGISVTVVPASTRAEEVLAMRPDGVFLSNGPGDPAGVPYAADCVKKLLGRFPILGVGLGHQFLAMSMGGESYRLPHGHHGGNHPVRDFLNDRAIITTQSHSHAIWAESIPDAKAEITHLSLNDSSVEGIRAREYPAFSVQFLPESMPGLAETPNVFKDFYNMIADWSRRRASTRGRVPRQDIPGDDN